MRPQLNSGTLGGRAHIVNVLTRVEDLSQFLGAADTTRPHLVLAISQDLTLGGVIDRAGLAMAVVLDQVLAFGYLPDGFQQCDGYRLYRYQRPENENSR
jgi:hypothetical protein